VCARTALRRGDLLVVKAAAAAAQQWGVRKIAGH
jgi:hypothetical protein